MRARRRSVGAPHTTRRRVRLLLPVLLIVTLAYPVTLVHPVLAVAHALCYVAVLALGARVASVTPRRRYAATAIAGVTALLIVPLLLAPDAVWPAVTSTACWSSTCW
ncbi:MAG: hypothetical protein KY460_01480 [Actinobacteria bacterium]|nr:hypothetical protein [Actinomycetota bacterium]